MSPAMKSLLNRPTIKLSSTNVRDDANLRLAEGAKYKGIFFWATHMKIKEQALNAILTKAIRDNAPVDAIGWSKSEDSWIRAINIQEPELRREAINFINKKD